MGRMGSILTGIACGLVFGFLQYKLMQKVAKPDQSASLRALIMFVKLLLWAAAMIGMYFLSLWALVTFVLSGSLGMVITTLIGLKKQRKGERVQ